GSPVRRFRQRGAGDHRPVHRLGAPQVGSDAGAGAAAAAWLRGQGPEHSSARLERFLQLAAEDNIRVANLTSAAQYFHLLRRQALLLDADPRPLVIIRPRACCATRAPAHRWTTWPAVASSA